MPIHPDLSSSPQPPPLGPTGSLHNLQSSAHQKLAPTKPTTTSTTTTTMAPFTSFALIGAGTLGVFIAKEMIAQSGISVKLLTRDATKPEMKQFEALGATIVQVDYSSPDDLRRALTGVDVVISTISYFGVKLQVDIARTAKAAGVKLFVPSEFGIEATDGVEVQKQVVRDALKAMSMPYTLFFPGLFADVYHMFFDYNYKGGYINVVDRGDVQLSLTSRYDIARFVAHTLTTADPADLLWAELRFEADRLSPLEIAALAEKKLSKKIEIRSQPYANFKAKEATDLVAFLAVQLADGKGMAGEPAGVSQTIAKFFPTWNPTTYDAFISEA